MIVTEYYMTRSDGVVLVRTYSDQGHYIANQDGVVYSEAIDPENSGRTYAETDDVIKIEPDFQYIK